MSKVLVIVGPTAVGKTSLAVYLACHFGGEIVSADSRQVYKGMDIVTGKELSADSKFVPIQSGLSSRLRTKKKKLSVGYRLKDRVPIWLVDIVDPDYTFNVGEYIQLAKNVIEHIQSRNKLPIIVGGTGLYIKALINPLSYINIAPSPLLRRKLEVQSKAELQKEFCRLDSDWWNRMNNSDKNNPRRLIRAIEITKKIKKTPMRSPEYTFLMIGLTAPNTFLYQQIDRRVDDRVKDGVIEEVRSLLQRKYDRSLPLFSSTGIRQLHDAFEGKKTMQKAIEEWKFAEHAYARRQKTWFKKESNIAWFDVTQKSSLSKIEEKVQTWYTLP